MTKRFNSMKRKLAPWLAAGMLLQAGGCQIDTTEAATQLITAVVGTLLQSLVFGAFNLV